MKFFAIFFAFIAAASASVAPAVVSTYAAPVVAAPAWAGYAAPAWSGYAAPAVAYSAPLAYSAPVAGRVDTVVAGPSGTIATSRGLGWNGW